MAATLKIRDVLTLLRKEPLYCAVVNRYAKAEATDYLTNKGYQKLPNLPLDCYTPGRTQTEHHMSFPPSPQTSSHLLYYYIMDVSSLIPVLSLCPEAEHRVLDLCSAPGGKAFALAQFLSLGRTKGGSMALNDVNRSRLRRLKEVMSKCLPQDMRCSVRFTQRRGEEWAKIEQNSYDRVLVDVPCSSDRHKFEEWLKKDVSYPDTIEFSNLQQKILLAGLHAAKSGGIVAYSTCTLSEAENDGVVLGTLTKAKDQGIKVKLLPTPDSCLPLLTRCGPIRTETGVLVVPTQSSNCGPLFTSLMQRC